MKTCIFPVKLNSLKWEGWQGKDGFTTPPKAGVDLGSSLERLASVGVTNT